MFNVVTRLMVAATNLMMQPDGGASCRLLSAQKASARPRRNSSCAALAQK